MDIQYPYSQRREPCKLGSALNSIGAQGYCQTRKSSPSDYMRLFLYIDFEVQLSWLSWHGFAYNVGVRCQWDAYSRGQTLSDTFDVFDTNRTDEQMVSCNVQYLCHTIGRIHTWHALNYMWVSRHVWPRYLQHRAGWKSCRVCMFDFHFWMKRYVW